MPVTRTAVPRLAVSSMMSAAIELVCASTTASQAPEGVVSWTVVRTTVIPRADEASAAEPRLEERLDSSTSGLALGGVLMVKKRLTDAAMTVNAT